MIAFLAEKPDESMRKDEESEKQYLSGDFWFVSGRCHGGSL